MRRELHVSKDLEEFYRAFHHEMRERPFEWAGLTMWAGTEAKMGLSGQLPGQQPRGNLIDRINELESHVGLLAHGLEDLMKNVGGIREAIGISQPSDVAAPGSLMPEGQRVYYPGDEGPRQG